MTSRVQFILERAQEFLEAAKDSLAEERHWVAFDEARPAAELA